MSNGKPDVTVLLFCYNEQEALPHVIADIRAALDAKVPGKPGRYSYEILLVDDGSTDQSAAIAEGLSCRVIRHPFNKGAGAACKTGILSAQGDIIVMLDADGTYTAADIPKMLAFFPEFDQVNGARTSEQGDLPWLRAPAKWLVRMFVSLLAGKRIPDLQTGLKAFKRQLMLPYLWAIPDKFSHCPLITLAFLCNGRRVKYIPTAYHKRLGGFSKFHPVRDTIYVLWQVCRFLTHVSPLRIFFPAALLSIMGVGIAVYANTFHASFHFDDEIYIVNNFFIRNLHNLIEHWQFYPCRLITFLSIVFNYRVNGLNVAGYHLFNLTVHLSSAMLAWWLTLLTFSTPVMKEPPAGQAGGKVTWHAGLISIFVGLLFVSHPVQIEAVTYIWQRAASMVTFFYLASLCLYIQSRLLQVEGPASHRGRGYYIFSLVMAMAAMFTKENAITLPLMVLFYEISFFGAKKCLNGKRQLLFLLTLAVIPLTIVFTKAGQFTAIVKFARSPGGTSPLQYLLTQFRVIVTYIRLVFLPFHLNLDYDYPISKSIFELPTLISLLFLTGVFCFWKYLFSTYRLLFFAIGWFFLTLSVESSFLPLKNIIFEHRLYLPMVGYSLFLVSGVYYLWGKDHIKGMIIVLTAVIAFNSILTYQRNKVWANEITLWEDAVQKSPHKARVYDNLAFAYDKAGRFTQAIAGYNKALAIDPNMVDAYVGRGLSFSKQGNFTQAIADYNKAIAMEPDFEEAYNNRGIFYFHQGRFAQAVADLSKAIALNPNDAQAYYNRGLCDAKIGNLDQAIVDYTAAIKVDPGDADAYYSRGLIFARQGFLRGAAIDFKKAIDIDPGYGDAYNNLGIVNAFQGNLPQALTDLSRAIQINPDSAEAYCNRGNVYSQQGMYMQALADYTKAVQIDPKDAEAYNDRGLVNYELKQYVQAWADVRRAAALGITVNPQLIRALKAASG